MADFGNVEIQLAGLSDQDLRKILSGGSTSTNGSNTLFTFVGSGTLIVTRKASMLLVF